MGFTWALGMTSVSRIRSGSCSVIAIRRSSLLFVNWSMFVYRTLRLLPLPPASLPSHCRCALVPPTVSLGLDPMSPSSPSWGITHLISCWLSRWSGVDASTPPLSQLACLSTMLFESLLVSGDASCWVGGALPWVVSQAVVSAAMASAIIIFLPD